MDKLAAAMMRPADDLNAQPRLVIRARTQPHQVRMIVKEPQPISAAPSRSFVMLAVLPGPDSNRLAGWHHGGVELRERPRWKQHEHHNHGRSEQHEAER